jgi:hypothetical protein
MPYKTIQIDLGNANWRYVTGIHLVNDLYCSIYPSNNVGIDRLPECQAIYPKMTFRIVEVK